MCTLEPLKVGAYPGHPLGHHSILALATISKVIVITVRWRSIGRTSSHWQFSGRGWKCWWHLPSLVILPHFHCYPGSSWYVEHQLRCRHLTSQIRWSRIRALTKLLTLSWLLLGNVLFTSTRFEISIRYRYSIDDRWLWISPTKSSSSLFSQSLLSSPSSPCSGSTQG